MRGHEQTRWMGPLLGLLLLCTRQAEAVGPALPDSAITAELQALASHAATIFVGQIVSIQRRTSAVEVVFRVEKTISGAPGQRFVLREWAGLWPSGHSRYLVGQRVLAFVHGASVAGFSSPVHGAEGLVPVVVQGADVPQLLDVRRVAASVVRTPGTPLPSQADGAISLEAALASFMGTAPGTAPELTRLPIPVRAHPPAAMQPSHGLGALTSSTPGSAMPLWTDVLANLGKRSDAAR